MLQKKPLAASNIPKPSLLPVRSGVGKKRKVEDSMLQKKPLAASNIPKPSLLPVRSGVGKKRKVEDSQLDEEHVSKFV